MKEEQTSRLIPIKNGEYRQKTDNTAASTGNSGTIHIGKGADESITTKLELRDSTISINLNSTQEDAMSKRIHHEDGRRKTMFLTLSLSVIASGLTAYLLRVITQPKTQKK